MAEFTAVCQHCLEPLTAQRSTRRYHDNCRSAAYRLTRKQERSALACWVCGDEIDVRPARPQAVLSREKILSVECPECGAEPDEPCSRYDEKDALSARAWRQGQRKPSHVRRVEEARDRLFAAAEAEAELALEGPQRRLCGKRECKAKARRWHRIYRDAEKSSGRRSVTRDGSGSVIVQLPEPVPEAAFKRLLELVRRPGRNTVVIRVPVVAESPFDPDFTDLTFTRSALTDRDEMWVALALAGLGAKAPERKEPGPSLAEPRPADGAPFAHDSVLPVEPSARPELTWDDFMPD